jgi:hypothetical protein
MIRKYILYIGALGIFGLLIVGDFFYQQIYYQSAQQHLDICLNRREKDKIAANDCLFSANAANNAFNSATTGHVSSYLAFTLILTIIAGRISQLEGRIKELEGKRDV